MNKKKNKINTINSKLNNIESKCFRLETKQNKPKINKIIGILQYKIIIFISFNSLIKTLVL